MSTSELSTRGNAFRCKVTGVGWLGAIAMPWRKKLKIRPVDEQAKAFIEKHGDEAYYKARNAAREARNKRDRKRARHYSLLALRIAEMTGKPIGLDTAKRVAQRGEPGTASQ
jgi:hypothetical protein